MVKGDGLAIKKLPVHVMNLSKLVTYMYSDIVGDNLYAAYVLQA